MVFYKLFDCTMQFSAESNKSRNTNTRSITKGKDDSSVGDPKQVKSSSKLRKAKGSQSAPGKTEVRVTVQKY